jgi:hypothetical protein
MLGQATGMALIIRITHSDNVPGRFLDVIR